MDCKCNGGDVTLEELADIMGMRIAPSEHTKSILGEADKIINGERAKDYGSASDNIGNIAKFWSVILGQEITTEQVNLCMIAVKMARLVNSPSHRDSWLDIGGYVGVQDKIWRGE